MIPSFEGNEKLSTEKTVPFAGWKMQVERAAGPLKKFFDPAFNYEGANRTDQEQYDELLMGVISRIDMNGDAFKMVSIHCAAEAVKPLAKLWSALDEKYSPAGANAGLIMVELMDKAIKGDNGLLTCIDDMRILAQEYHRITGSPISDDTMKSSLAAALRRSEFKDYNDKLQRDVIAGYPTKTFEELASYCIFYERNRQAIGGINKPVKVDKDKSKGEDAGDEESGPIALVASVKGLDNTRIG